MRQNTASLVSGEGDTAIIAAAHAGYSVVARETLIEKRVAGIEELKHAAVLAHDVLEEYLGLALQVVAQRLVELPVLVGIRAPPGDVSQMEPLPGEVVDQGLGLRVGEHPADLLL